MGLRFRKSFKIAPGVKFNINKNSTSVTMGGKYFHHTVNSNGKKTSAVSIPGSGVSYSTSTSSKRTSSAALSSPKNNSQKSFNQFLWCIVALLALMICFGGLASCLDNSNAPEPIADVEAEIDTSSEESSEVTEQTEFITMYTTSAANVRSGPGTDFDVIDKLQSGTEVTVVFETDGWSQLSLEGQEAYVSSDYLTAEIPQAEQTQVEPVQAEQPQPVQTEQAPTEPVQTEQPQATPADTTPEQTTIPAQADSSVQSNPEPQVEMVWIPESGSKYHRNSSCSGMNNPTQVSKDQAINMGYSACKKCY